MRTSSGRRLSSNSSTSTATAWGTSSLAWCRTRSRISSPARKRSVASVSWSGGQLRGDLGQRARHAVTQQGAEGNNRGGGKELVQLLDERQQFGLGQAGD